MIAGLDEFLQSYPEMRIVPSIGEDLVLRGNFAFIGQCNDKPDIEDTYQLELLVPPAFPRELPLVLETGGRIPRHVDFHVYSNNCLCLGSPLRLRGMVSLEPTLPGFIRRCLVPYLYAMSHKLLHGGNFVFDELAHGEPGLLDDYQQLFGLKNAEQVKAAYRLLGLKVRRANKERCPCGCGRRVGQCSFNRRLAHFRSLGSRTWFRTVDLNGNVLK